MAIRIQPLNVNSIGDIAVLWHLDLQPQPTYFVAHVQDSVRMDVLDLCRAAGFCRRLLILAGVDQTNLHDPAVAPLLRRMIARHFPEQPVEGEVFVDALADCGRKGPTLEECEAIRRGFEFLHRPLRQRVLAVQPLSTDHERKSALHSLRFLDSIRAAESFGRCDAIDVLASPSQADECQEFAARIGARCRVLPTMRDFFAACYNAAAFVGCESTGAWLAAFFGVPTWLHYRGSRPDLGPHFAGIGGRLPHFRTFHDPEHT